jgi:hypothetical protein
MMPKELPPCLVCTCNNYKPGGGRFGGEVSQQGFSCGTCGVDVMLLSMDMCHVLLYAPTDAHTEYVNRYLLSAWRAWKTQVELLRSKIRMEHLHVVNEAMGLPQETTGYTVGEERYSEWARRLDEMAREHRLTILFPPDCEPCPLPPQMPGDMLAMHRPTLGGGWVRIMPEETRLLRIPPDPIRVHHEAVFTEIRHRVEAVTSQAIIFDQIPNEYFDDKYAREPWYTFRMPRGTIVIGPRKRVISIQARDCDPPISTEALYALAERDNVTWEADGGWKSKISPAKSCEIHAYGKDKAVEYLTALVLTMAGQ